MSESPRRAWPVVRALLLTAVVAVEWLDALPLPTLRPYHLNQPIAKAELARWTAVLNGAGVEITQDELAERGLAVGGAAVSFRQWSMGPFRPLKKLTQTGQSWGLFAYPDPFAGRLIVESDTGEGWQERFRAPGSGDTLLSRQLRYRRVRGIYDDLGDVAKPRGGYSRFADWVAARLMAEAPETKRVRVRLDLVRVKLPGEGTEPPEELRHARVRSRKRMEQRAATLAEAREAL